MRFGIFLPHVGHHAGPEAIREMASAAEELGFVSAWTGDHLGLARDHSDPYPATEDGVMTFAPDRPFIEAFSTLSYTAAVTSTLRLGIGVAIIPLRHPVLLAKLVAALDVLSGGRAALGVGVGWMRETFSAMGIAFEERGRRTDEALELLQLTFATSGPVTYSGEWTHVDAMYFNPPPVQGSELPIWVGGVAGPALRRAARFGYAWYRHIWRASPEYLVDAMKTIAASRDESRLPIRCTMMSPFDMNDARADDEVPPWQSGWLNGTPDGMIARLTALAGVPVDELVLGMNGRASVRITAMERFAAEVMPALA